MCRYQNPDQYLACVAQNLRTELNSEKPAVSLLLKVWTKDAGVKLEDLPKRFAETQSKGIFADLLAAFQRIATQIPASPAATAAAIALSDLQRDPRTIRRHFAEPSQCISPEN